MHELDSQLQALRVRCIQPRIEKKHSIEARFISSKMIVQRCCQAETYFEKAYRSILNEFFPYKPLRDMLRYQITGIYSVFRQLKLLNSVMPAQVSLPA
jgi:hypothetical protein